MQAPRLFQRLHHSLLAYFGESLTHCLSRFISAVAMNGLLVTSAHALCPTSSSPIVVSAFGTVTAKLEFINPKGAFSDDLILDDPENNLGVIFNSKTTPAGSTVVLGTFEAGTELKLRLHVRDTNQNFFTGPAERNPDGLPHTLVTATSTGLRVGFEDLFGLPECPNDSFTDLVFSFTNLEAKFGKPDSYLNFKTSVAAGAEPVLPRSISVRDRFVPEGTQFDLSTPFRLAMPARTPTVKARNPAVALASFRLSNGVPQTPAVVDVFSELGKFQVTLGAADRLMAPAAFSRIANPAPPSSQTNRGILDPLKCYAVSYKKRQFAQLQKNITLRSKFSGSRKDYVIRRALRLCTPASVDADRFLPNRSDTNLMCFSASPANGVISRGVPNIFVNTTFGGTTVNTVRDREICLPSTLTTP